MLGARGSLTYKAQQGGSTRQLVISKVVLAESGGVRHDAALLDDKKVLHRPARRLENALARAEET